MSHPQLGLPLGWRDGGRFEDYHAGSSNSAAVAQLRTALQEPDQALLLQGPAGSGKTHLALAVRTAAADGGSEARYLGLRRPPQQALALLQSLPCTAVVCLDDIDHLLGEAELELALFDAFNRIRDGHGLLLLSSRRRPRPGDFQLPDLASRVLGATPCVLSPLEEEELAQAWEARARMRGLQPDAAAVNWILRHLPRDFSSLMQALDHLDAAALAAGRRLSLPFVRSVLQPPSPEP